MQRDDVVRRPVIQTSAGTASRSAHQAFRLLHILFVIAPTIAGLDKFFHLLTNWDQYLAPQVAGVLPFSVHTFMMAVGAIEIIAGLIVAIKPRIGGVIVGLWLLGIVVNLILVRGYYDIALRDFGLALAAFALARLAKAHDEAPTLV